MKRWYVLQVYAGYEEQAKEDIKRRLADAALEEHVGELLIPSAKLRRFFDTGDGVDEQLFPGYVLIEMELLPEVMRVVLASARVVRFLPGREPMPLSQQEVDRFLSQMRGEVALAPEKEDFVVGSEVEVASGPFTGFVGHVFAINKEGKKVTLMVSILGRMTPVELSFDQVKR